MSPKLAFRKRILCIVLVTVLLVIVLRLSYQRSSDTWVTYSAWTPISHGQRSSHTRTILLWTNFFSQPDYIKSMTEVGCSELNCLVTSNRSALDRSEAILFHARDTSISDLPASRFPWQRWVLLHHESPHHTPDFFHQLDGHFNWTITYRLDSDIILSPLPRLKKQPKLQQKTNFSANKTRMAVWFVSNCQTPSNREAYVKELQKTIPVDIVGSCFGGHECVPKMSTKCYKEAAGEYRFYLSFENSICKDYVTEKFYHILSYDIVPVVLSGADFSKMAPPGSYIDALDFESPRALGRHLLELAKDEERYNAYFEWRETHELVSENYACRLCRKLHDNTEPAKVWRNLYKWWFEDAKCKKWPAV